MKGPGLRITHDVRRLFTCPACGRKLKLPGQVTSQQCGCRPEGAWMQLRERPVLTPPRKQAETAALSALEEQPDDDGASKPKSEPTLVQEQASQVPVELVAESESISVTDTPKRAEENQPKPDPKAESQPSPGEKRPRKKRQRKRRRKGKVDGDASSPPPAAGR